MTTKLRVWVKPGSRKGPLVQPPDDGREVDLVVYVTERAVDGAANAAVLRAVADHLGLAVAAVHLHSGATSRLKQLRVD